ncbi:MAG: leucine-rich repeat domain-containing protein, partial [Clostridia bacterium]|nr:leucine-rich repeat domain-containing protein [Clostridia bacterium]
ISIRWFSDRARGAANGGSYYDFCVDFQVGSVPHQVGDAEYRIIWTNAKGQTYIKPLLFHVVPMDLPTKLYNVPEIINLRKGYGWDIWGALEFTDEDVMWDCFNQYQEVTISGDGWQDYVVVYTDTESNGVFAIYGLEAGTAEFDVNIYIAGSDFYVTQHMKVNVIEPETLTLPASTIRIEDGAFQNTATDRVIIPEGCVSIGSKAFANCENLWDVHIPASVTYIAPDAFEGSFECWIVAPAHSYAMDYANAHNIYWDIE